MGVARADCSIQDLVDANVPAVFMPHGPTLLCCSLTRLALQHLSAGDLAGAGDMG